MGQLPIENVHGWVQHSYHLPVGGVIDVSMGKKCGRVVLSHVTFVNPI